MPIRTIAPGTPATGDVTAFEFDLAGSGGTLSDGTISIDGYDFTLTGIGTSTGIFLTLPLADLLASYDGSKHSVEIVADIDRGSWTESASVCGISRRTAIGAGYENAMSFYYFSASGAYFQLVSNVDGAYSFVQTLFSYSTLEPERLGLIAAGRASVGTARTVTTGDAVRVAEDAIAYNWVVNDGTANAATPYGTGDLLQVACSVYAGGVRTTTATQSASGINFSIGSSDFTLKKLYVFIGTAVIP